MGQFLDDKLIKKEEKNEKGERFVDFYEFTSKTHEFEVFLRDEKIFDQKTTRKIKISDEDLTKAGTQEIATNGWIGFQVNPFFDLKARRHELEPIKGHATKEGTYKYAARNPLVNPFNFNRV